VVFSIGTIDTRDWATCSTALSKSVCFEVLATTSMTRTQAEEYAAARSVGKADVTDAPRRVWKVRDVDEGRLCIKMILFS
jgi:hypothetical protein